MLAAYPQGQDALVDARAEEDMQAIIELVSRVRNIRSEMNIKPGEAVPLVVAAPDAKLRAVFEAGAAQIARLVRASNVSVEEQLDAPRASARAVLAGGAEVAVPLEGLIDFAQERERLRREEEKLAKEEERLRGQLANENFVARAPAEKVSELRQRLMDIEQRTGALKQSMEAFAE
jgi:valyl-tRNA synthetase